MPNWYQVEAEGTCYYTPWHFQPLEMVNCGFSTRIGGASKAPYDGLNLSFTVGDEHWKVAANRRVFAAALGINAAHLVVPNQVHSNTVKRVTEHDAGSGANDHSTAIPDTDALITNTPNLPLALQFADCVCVFFVDPINKAIGVAHAGWRGTVEGIVISTVEAMTREFGTDPNKLLAAISPSVERHCYEVGEDVASHFFKLFPDDDRAMRQSSLVKWRVDLKTANLIMLQRAGVAEGNVAISERCTCCDADEFFSYRRDGVTGRMGGWLSLKSM